MDRKNDTANTPFQSEAYWTAKSFSVLLPKPVFLESVTIVFKAVGDGMLPVSITSEVLFGDLSPKSEITPLQPNASYYASFNSTTKLPTTSIAISLPRAHEIREIKLNGVRLEDLLSDQYAKALSQPQSDVFTTYPLAWKADSPSNNQSYYAQINNGIAKNLVRISAPYPVNAFILVDGDFRSTCVASDTVYLYSKFPISPRRLDINIRNRTTLENAPFVLEGSTDNATWVRYGQSTFSKSEFYIVQTLNTFFHPGAMNNYFRLSGLQVLGDMCNIALNAYNFYEIPTVAKSAATCAYPTLLFSIVAFSLFVLA
jgi:hypothetical protein